MGDSGRYLNLLVFLNTPNYFVSLLKSTLPQRKTMNKETKTKTKTYKTCVLYSTGY
jgi:hypothetical protein